MIVIDASAVIAFLLGAQPQAQALEARLIPTSEELHAPHMLDLEVAQYLRRGLIRGEIPSARADAAFDHFSQLRVERYPHHPFMPRIWQLRHNIAAYDAMYVALAEALAAPLITLDGRLAAAPGHSATIEVF